MRRALSLNIILSIISIILLAAVPFLGHITIDPSKLFGDDLAARIFWNIRVPRALCAFTCGGVLALCGMTFQSMFKNDLATPYTLGVSSGAALGAVVAIRFFAGSFALSQIMSFAGAVATIALIYLLTAIKRELSSAFLLLAGIAVSFTCNGLILFIQYLSNSSESSLMIRWMMGSLDLSGYSPLMKIAPSLLILTVILAFFHRELDLMRINSDVAASRGVNLKFTVNLLFLAVSLAIAAVISQTGPIGFVGMVAPHIAAKFTGRKHSLLIPSSLLLGGIILLVSDTLARCVIAPSEVPAGVITSLLGGPFFIFILLKNSRR